MADSGLFKPIGEGTQLNTIGIDQHPTYAVYAGGKKIVDQTNL